MSFDLSIFSKTLGWELSGVCSPEVDQATKDRYHDWLQKHKAEMGYLERRKKEKLCISEYFPEAKSVLCFGFYYFPGWAKGDVKVSNYSWGEDYHIVIQRKLEQTALALSKKFENFQYKICVDTQPILEKYFAIKAGLGWQGKNTLVLNRKLGSLFFLGEILTNLEPSVFKQPTLSSDYCGNCTKCVEACPTDALEDYVLKAEKCISYFTLEQKSEFNQSTPHWNEWVAGCDICQEVCPWNQKLIPLQEGFDSSMQNLSFDDLLAPNWLERISGKAVSYVKKASWARNINHIRPKP